MGSVGQASCLAAYRTEGIEMIRGFFTPEVVAVKEFYSSSPHINETHLDSIDISKPVILAEIVPGRYNLNDLEKIARLHYYLDINIEGIDTVINLLNRINDMQDEISLLWNRLKLYEGN